MNGLGGDNMNKLKYLIRGKKTNYFSYFTLIILITILGAKSFVRPIYLTIIDLKSMTGDVDSFYFYLFSFGFCSFSFGLGAMIVSLIKLLPNLSNLSNPSLVDEIEEYIFMGVVVVIGALLVLLLILIQ